MANELEIEIYQAKHNIEQGKRTLERMKAEYKKDIKTQTSYLNGQKAKLKRLEKKYFGKKRE